MTVNSLKILNILILTLLIINNVFVYLLFTCLLNTISEDERNKERKKMIVNMIVSLDTYLPTVSNSIIVCTL